MPLSEVRDCITQHDGDGRALTRHFAVKCADIYVAFPKHDVAGLGLVDLPGLEMARGHAQKLVASLQREIDAIAVIRRPDAVRQYWGQEDVIVFDLIKQSVPELDLSDWLFLVFNRMRDGTNEDGIKELRQMPRDLGSSTQELVADCSNPEEANSKVFAPILRHLEANLDRIDRRYCSDLTQQLSSLSSEVEAALNDLQNRLATDTTGNSDFAAFNRLFEESLKRQHVNLEDLVNSFRTSKEAQDIVDQFGAAITRACDIADAAAPVPSESELRKEYQYLGGWPGVVQECQHRLRAHVANHLDRELNPTLQTIVNDVIEKLETKLLSDPLSRLLPSESARAGSRQRLEYLQQVLLDSGKVQAAGGLEYLLSFGVSYRSHFHYRVREVLNPFDPAAPESIQGDIPKNDDNPVDLAPEIRNILVGAYRQVVYEVRCALTEKLKQDSFRAVYAMLEDVKDRLIRVEGVRDEWRDLFYERRQEIWPESFLPLAVASARRQQLQREVDAILATANRLRINVMT